MIRIIIICAALAALLWLLRHTDRPQPARRYRPSRPCRAFTAESLLALDMPLPIVTELQDESGAWSQWDSAVADLERSMGLVQADRTLMRALMEA